MKTIWFTLSALLLAGTIGLAQANKNNVPVAATVTDIDGNVYRTVTIGTQVWTAENLKPRPWSAALQADLGGLSVTRALRR